MERHLFRKWQRLSRITHVGRILRETPHFFVVTSRWERYGEERVDKHGSFFVVETDDPSSVALAYEAVVVGGMAEVKRLRDELRAVEVGLERRALEAAGLIKPATENVDND